MFSKRPSKDGSADNKSQKDAGQTPPTDKSRSRSNSIKSILGFGSNKAAAASDNDSIHSTEADELKHLSPLCRAVYNNDISKFKDLISKKKTDIAAVDIVHKRNVFHWCALQANSEFLTAMYDFKGKANFQALINSGDSEGKTPLILATVARNIDVLRALLNETPHAINTPDTSGRTPLQYAVLEGDIACTTILILRGANVNVTNEQGLSILMEALSKGLEEPANILITNQANARGRDAKKRVPLYYAVKSSSLKNVKALLHSGAKADDKDIENRTPLQFAEELMSIFKSSQTSKTEIQTMEKIVILLRESLGKPPLSSKNSSTTSSGEFPMESAVNPLVLENALKRNSTTSANSSPSSFRGNSPIVGASSTMDRPRVSSGPISSASLRSSIERPTIQTMPRLAPNYTSSSSLRPVPLGQSSNATLAKSRSFHELTASDFEKPELVVINPLSRRQSMDASDITLGNHIPAKREENKGVIMEEDTASLRSRSGDLFGSKDSTDIAADMEKVIVSKEEIRKLLARSESDPVLSSPIEKESDVLNVLSHLLDTRKTLMSPTIKIEDDSKQDSLEAENEKYRADNERLREEYQKVVADNGKLLEDNENLSEVLGQKEADILTLQTQLTDLATAQQAQKAADNEQLSAMKTQVVNLAQELREKDMQLLDLETEIEDEKQKVQQVTDQLMKTANQLNETKSQLESQPKATATPLDLANIKKQFLQKDEEINRLKKDLFQTKTELEETEAKLETALADPLRNKVAEKEMQYLTAGYVPKNKLGTIGDSQEKLHDIGEEPFSSKEQLYSELSSELTAAQHRLVLEISQKKSFEEEALSLREAIQDSTEKNASLKAECDKAAKANASFQKTIQILESQIDSLTDQLDQANAQLQEEKRTNQKLNEKNGSLQDALTNADGMLKRQQRAVDTPPKIVNSAATTQIVELEQQVFNLEQALVAKTEEIASLRKSSDGESYFKLLEDRFDKEQRVRGQLESELKLYKNLAGSIGTAVEEIVVLYQDVVHDRQTEVVTRESLDKLLLKAEDLSTLTLAKLDEHLKTVLNLKSKIKDTENLVKTKESEIQNLKQLDQQNKDHAGKLADENTKLQERLLDLERMILENKSKDRDEIKNLQVVLKTKASEMDQKEMQLVKQAAENEAFRKEKEAQLQALKTDREELGKTLVKEREKSLRDIADLNHQAENLRQKVAEKDEKIKVSGNEKIQLELKAKEANQQIASLKETVSQKSATIEALKENIAELEQLKPELDQAKDAIHKLQGRITNLMHENNEHLREIETLKKGHADLVAQKELLLAESVTLRSKLSDEKNDKNQLSEGAQAVCAYLEKLSLKSSEPPLSTKRAETAVALNFTRLEEYLEAIDDMWTKNEDIFSFIKTQQTMWDEWATKIDDISPSASAIKKAMNILSAHLDSFLGRKVSNHYFALNKRMARILMELNVESKKLESTREIKDIEQQNKHKETINTLQTEKQTLEDRIAQLKDLSSNLQRDMSQNTEKHQKDHQSLTDQTEGMKAKLNQREMELADLTRKMIKLEEAASQNENLKRQTSIIEQELRRQMEAFSQAQMEIAFLKQELQDRDPDFVQELDRLKDQEDAVMSAFANKATFEVSSPVEPMFEIRSPLRASSPSHRLRTASVISRSGGEKTNIMKTLKDQMASLEKEYKSSQAFWEKTKRQMEDEHSKEQAELLDQIKAHQVSLDNLEQSLHRIAIETRERTQGATVKLLDSLLDRMEQLQGEREQLEMLRQSNERKLLQNYDIQVQRLLHDLDVMRHQYHTLQEKYFAMEKSCSIVSKSMKPAQLEQQAKIREQLLEMRKLIKRDV